MQDENEHELGAPYTLHPTPYTLHPTLYSLHPTPYTLYPTPYTLHPTPYTLNLVERTTEGVPYKDQPNLGLTPHMVSRAKHRLHFQGAH